MDGVSPTDLGVHSIRRENTIFTELKTSAVDDIHEVLGDEELFNKLEEILLSRIDNNDVKAPFLLAELYFEDQRFTDAKKYFKHALEKNNDQQSKFQLGVMKYDGLGCKQNMKRGFEIMSEIAEDTQSDPEMSHIYLAAAYNIGLAYFQGFGVKQSMDEAEKWWVIAASDGDPKGSIPAQVALGHFYCNRDTLDLEKAFFWLSEACGSGNLEAQGALGVMYMMGLGTHKDDVSAFECLREAAERGNVYAMGHLVQYYYKRRFYTKTTQLAFKMAQFDDVETIVKKTGCLPAYVRKGLSLSSFILGRCLQQGLGVLKDVPEAKTYFSKSYHFDPDMCAKLQKAVLRSEI